jgi:hypothetical protein
MSITHSVSRSVGPKPQTVREQLQKLQTADHSRIGTISSMVCAISYIDFSISQGQTSFSPVFNQTSKITSVRNMNNQSGATFLALQRQRVRVKCLWFSNMKTSKLTHDSFDFSRLLKAAASVPINL